MPYVRSKLTTVALVLAVAGTMGVSACSRAQVADNTAEAAVGATKLVVRGAVGAGKLAVRGGRQAIAAARESREPKSAFPVGTAVCENAQGGYYAALTREDGTLFCLQPKA